MNDINDNDAHPRLYDEEEEEEEEEEEDNNDYKNIKEDKEGITAKKSRGAKKIRFKRTQHH